MQGGVCARRLSASFPQKAPTSPRSLFLLLSTPKALPPVGRLPALAPVPFSCAGFPRLSLPPAFARLPRLSLPRKEAPGPKPSPASNPLFSFPLAYFRQKMPAVLGGNCSCTKSIRKSYRSYTKGIRKSYQFCTKVIL